MSQPEEVEEESRVLTPHPPISPRPVSAHAAARAPSPEKKILFPRKPQKLVAPKALPEIPSAIAPMRPAAVAAPVRAKVPTPPPAREPTPPRAVTPLPGFINQYKNEPWVEQYFPNLSESVSILCLFLFSFIMFKIEYGLIFCFCQFFVICFFLLLFLLTD